MTSPSSTAQRLLALIRVLTAKTRAGEIQWKKNRASIAFVEAVSYSMSTTSSSIIVRDNRRNLIIGGGPEIRVYDGKGDVVEQYTGSTFPVLNGELDSALDQLVEALKADDEKVDRFLDNVIGEIQEESRAREREP
jgi:hypothetical protein